MSNQKELEALRAKIKERERQLYRTNLEANAWSKGKHNSHSNSRMAKTFEETSRQEIAELRENLKKLQKDG
jgi:hypothetical protein